MCWTPWLASYEFTKKAVLPSQTLLKLNSYFLHNPSSYDSHNSWQASLLAWVSLNLALSNFILIGVVWLVFWPNTGVRKNDFLHCLTESAPKKECVAWLRFRKFLPLFFFAPLALSLFSVYPRIWKTGGSTLLFLLQDLHATFWSLLEVNLEVHFPIYSE